MSYSPFVKMPMNTVQVEAYDDMGHFMLNPYDSQLYSLVYKDIDSRIEKVNGYGFVFNRRKIRENVKNYTIGNTIYRVHFEL
jgi:hypothetical protein